MFYGHVLGFKGLERAVVVLAVKGIRDEERGRLEAAPSARPS